ncbi:hypothetical protein TNCV_2833191 [Trichonephila clavipes]|nr:hypothetical protein TNCV_2833191 [Trichonephila clavipes]
MMRQYLDTKNLGMSLTVDNPACFSECHFISHKAVQSLLFEKECKWKHDSSFDLCVFDNVEQKVCYFRVVSARETTVRLLNVPRQTVFDAICRFKELGNDGRRPESGRKRVTSYASFL